MRASTRRPTSCGFSDIALLGMVAALWLENSLLASMMALAVLLPDVAWNVSFFGRLATGKGIPGLTDYMFDADKPRYLRAFSLFHVFMPVLLVWTVMRLGYAPQALPAQTLLCWVVLMFTYWLTDPKLNVNWVFGLGDKPQQRIPPRVYLVLPIVVFPVLKSSLCFPNSPTLLTNPLASNSASQACASETSLIVSSQNRLLVSQPKPLPKMA